MASEQTHGHFFKYQTKGKMKMIYDKKYWEKRFTGKEPVEIRVAIKRVYHSFPKECMPQGEADPMYIMNLIASALGIGDGQGNFSFTNKQDAFYSLSCLRRTFRDKMEKRLTQAIDGRKKYNLLNQENLTGYNAGVADGKIDGLALALQILRETK